MILFVKCLRISRNIEISGDRENASITEFTAAFISRAEISALKRRYRIGMPKRVLEKGLPKGTIPFGYRKPIGHETDRKAIPEQDPIRAAVVLQIKDLFLSGQSLWQIANQLTEQKIKKSRGGYQWTDVTVREILKNKFYAGEISFGKTRITHDPLTGTVRRTDVPPGQIQTASGAHIPLWGKDTAHEIEAQFQRRGKKYTGIQSQRLSGLLYCGICGARMWVQYPGGYAHERKRQWACNKTPSHLCIKDSDLLPLVITELTKELKNAKEIEIPSQQEAAAANQRSLQDHRARKARILEAYESRALTLDEYKTRIASLNAAIHELETKQTQTERIAIGIKKQNEAIAGFVQLIEEIPNYLTEAPAQRVNTQLRAIIQTITVHPATVKIQLRTQ